MEYRAVADGIVPNLPASGSAAVMIRSTLELLGNRYLSGLERAPLLDEEATAVVRRCSKGRVRFESPELA